MLYVDAMGVFCSLEDIMEIIIALSMPAQVQMKKERKKNL